MCNRNSRFRAGDVAESLGVVLLQGATFIAPVPRTEDVGLDAVATLLKQTDSYNVAATKSFYVQLKSASVRSITFKGEKVEWLLSLELPFFVGSVNVPEARIDLYACHRLTQAVIEGLHCDQIIINLDSVPERDAPLGCRKLNVGPPVHSWTVNEMADKTFVDNAYRVLAPHLETAGRNLELSRCGRFEQLRWTTGSPPTPNGVATVQGPWSFDKVLGLAMPYISTCLLAAHVAGDDELFEKLLGAIHQMVQSGAEPDPLIESVIQMRRVSPNELRQ